MTRNDMEVQIVNVNFIDSRLKINTKKHQIIKNALTVAKTKESVESHSTGVFVLHLEGTPGDPPLDPAQAPSSSSRDKTNERGRSHERKHRHAPPEKQRYYSCDRYCSRDHCHAKSANASCATSPSEMHDASFSKQVGAPGPELASVTASGVKLALLQLALLQLAMSRPQNKPGAK